MESIISLLIITLAVAVFFRIVWRTKKGDASQIQPPSRGLVPPKVTGKSTQTPKLSYVHAPKVRTEALEGGGLYAKAAEDQTTRALSTLGPNYIIYPNIILSKGGYVKTTELDHLVISPYGIFCIETKSHSGSIYGGVYSKRWTQYLAGKGYPFYNPLFQNNNHCIALQSLLGTMQKSKIHNYVFFPYADKVRVESKDVFTSVQSLLGIIKAHKTPIYTIQELTDIAYLLAKYTASYESMHGKHVENVQNYLGERGE